MDTQGGVHDLFSDMYRHSGGVARSLPDQTASDANYGQYPSGSPAQSGLLYPQSDYNLKTNEPSSPGTVGNLFSAAGLSSNNNLNPYGSTYTNGHTDDYTQYRFGRPIESAGSASSYGGSSGYASFDGQGNHAAPTHDPYTSYATQDTRYGVNDPYSQTVGNQVHDSGNFMRQSNKEGGIPDPPSYSSLGQYYSDQSATPHSIQGQIYQNETPTYPYSIKSPEKEEPNFKYKPTTPPSSNLESSYPYNQSVSSSSVSELSELSSGLPGGYVAQTWDDELTSTWSTVPPPSEPPPPLPVDEPPDEDNIQGAASSDPPIPAPPPLPAASERAGGPPPPAPPPPPPLPTSKPPGLKTSTGIQNRNQNDEQVKYTCGKTV